MVMVWGSQRGPELLRGDIGRRREVAIFEPFQTDALLSLISFTEFVEIRHENLQPGLRRHPRVAVHQLFLIVIQIEIEPGII